MAEATKVLVVSLASNLDVAGELSSILGSGFEVQWLRGADRQKLDMALDGHVQYGIVHIFADGAVSVLDAADGLLPEAELITLIESQKALRFVVVAACNSYELVGGIHNALHIPVVGYNAPINDRAAVEFSRAFYRVWRRTQDIDLAVDRGRESLAVLYPSEASKVRLIDGDMITPARFGVVMEDVRGRLVTMDARLLGIESRLTRIEGVPRGWLVVGFILVVALFFAQIGAPFLNAALLYGGP